MGRCDMPEERIDEHLDDIDEWLATCEREFPVAFDEWNAANTRMGRAQGSFTEYLDYCRNNVPLFSYGALTYFGAIDDDDFIEEMD